MNELFNVAPARPGPPALALEEQPDYKLLTKGSGSLTNTELISLIISGDKSKAVETGRNLLNVADNCLYKLSKFSVNDLQRNEGISKTVALRLFAAMEIGRRKRQTDPKEKTKISSSQDIYNLYRPSLADLTYEEFHVLLLNRSNRVLKSIKISQGGVSGTVVDIRLILKDAINELASSMILVHNHPSGNLQPSHADTKLTTKISEAGKTMDIQVLDHIIITDSTYFSYSDEGLI